jgi:hypothetical protein
VVELIAATTTKTGLKVASALDTRTYQKGIKVTAAQMKSLNIRGDKFHPEWNYAVIPRTPDSKQLLLRLSLVGRHAAGQKLDPLPAYVCIVRR